LEIAVEYGNLRQLLNPQEELIDIIIARNKIMANFSTFPKKTKDSLVLIKLGNLFI